MSFAPRDPEIRESLHRKLAADGRKLNTVLNEFTVMRGNQRVDVAVVDELLEGFEIKSDVDTLKRLPDQAKYFSYCFHRMTLVVGPVLLEGALKLIPDWWGVLLATRNKKGVVVLRELRPALPNPKVNYRWVARLMWRDEIIAALRRLGFYRGASKLNHGKMAEHLRANVTEPELVELVTSTLLARTEWIEKRTA